MINQLFIAELASNLLFPILGYFFWDWTIYFILLFLLLDLLCDLIVTHYKARKIILFQGGTSFDVVKSIMAIVLFLITMFLFHLVIYFFQEDVNFGKEIIAFWNLKDLGIAQGYFLLPLLIVVSIQQYKIGFQMPALYRTMKQTTLWKNHFKSYFWLIAFAGIAIGQVLLLQVSELILFIILCLVLLTRTVSTRFS